MGLLEKVTPEQESYWVKRLLQAENRGKGQNTLQDFKQERTIIRFCVFCCCFCFVFVSCVFLEDSIKIII